LSGSFCVSCAITLHWWRHLLWNQAELSFLTTERTYFYT